MFSTSTFVAFFVSAAPFLVRAIVMPTIPAPGAVYNVNSPCPIAWDGDVNSTTDWKNMDIALMSGNNYEMEFITTVATSLDGTVSGTFSYPCPNVTPNSAIYFYQFVAPAVINGSWVGTGRFTIASTTGATTPPANATQPNGDDIPWGLGALVDPTTADGPPSFASSIFSVSSFVASNSSMSAVVASSATVNTTGSATAVLSSVITTPSPVLPSLSTSASPTSQSASGAVMTTFDIRVLGAAAVATLALSFVW